MNWKERLIKEAEEIVKHGEGELSFRAVPRSGNKVLVFVIAGETHRFEIEKK